MILACMSRLSTDIQGAFVQNPALTRSLPEAADKSLDPYRWVADTQLIAGERFSRLRFASRAHVAFGFDDNAGVAEIVYYVQQAGRQRFVLRRSDRLDFDQPFEPSPWDPVLCDDLRGFGITFFDNDRQPVDHWDSQDQSEGHATPRTVHVRIDIGDANGVSRRFETQVSVPVYHEAPK
jgi:general secretion pathway protein J